MPVHNTTLTGTRLNNDKFIYTATFCETTQFDSVQTTTQLLHGGEHLRNYLDHFGVPHEDYMFCLLNNAIGESELIGFPQGSFFGLIITRIA